MLRIGKPGSHKISSFGSTFINHYENGKLVYNIPASVGLALGGEDSFHEIKGRIATGSPLYEDRPCSHTDVDGLIYASTDDCRMIPHPSGIGFTLKNVSFTEIITGPCDRTLNFFARDSRARNREYLYYYGMRGNNVYHAITSRILPAVGPPPLFDDVMFIYRTYNSQRTKCSLSSTNYVPWKGDFVFPPMPELSLVRTPNTTVTLDTTVQQFDYVYYLIRGLLNHSNWDKICPKAVPLPPKHPLFGDLAVKALDSAKFIDANLFAFLSEYQSLSNLFGSLSKDVLSGHLAEAYLGYNYGLRNQISDYISITAGLEKTLTMRDRQPLEAVRASQRERVPNTTITKEYHYKIRYRPQASQGQTLLRILREYSLLPSFSMAWDLVPFSFVVDWFYSFQRELERHQFRTDHLLYNIVAITKSEKTVFTIKDTNLASEYQCLSGIKFTSYRRYVSNVVDQPSYFFTDGYVPNLGRHIVDGLCLLMKQ